MKKTNLIILTLLLIFSSNVIAQVESWSRVGMIHSSGDTLLTPPSRYSYEEFTHFGNSVSISGNYAIVGSPNRNRTNYDWRSNDEGVAYILKVEKGVDRNGMHGWSEVQKLVSNFPIPDDKFGTSVAISGNSAIVGIPGPGNRIASNSRRAGAVMFYNNNNGTWRRSGDFISPDPVVEANVGANYSGDLYGSVVAMHGNYAIVGAPSTVIGTGKVYLYEKIGNRWVYRQLLTNPIGAGEFGISISISDNYIAVGQGGNGVNHGADGLRSVHIYKNINSVWTHVQRIIRHNEDFGSAISISDNYMFISSNNNRHSGSVHVYKNLNGNWENVEQLYGHRGDFNFGNSVSISGNYAVIGASGARGESRNGESVNFTGAAYLYKNVKGAWEEVKELLNDIYLAEGDKFGNTVSISGNSIIVGAPNKHHRLNGLIRESGQVTMYSDMNIPSVNYSSPLKVISNKNTVTLTWATLSEMNNYGFEIEATTSSLDHKSSVKPFVSPKPIWRKIHFVKGNGNTNSRRSYTYRHIGNLEYKNYRLKQICLDGRIEYSDNVSVIKPKNNLFGKTKLLQNHPNPFNPSTQISFSLAETSQVNISIYNALGQRVAELVNGNMTAGTHNVEFDGSSLSSGFYVYRLETPNYSKTMKMLLVK